MSEPCVDQDAPCATPTAKPGGSSSGSPVRGGGSNAALKKSLVGKDFAEQERMLAPGSGQADEITALRSENAGLRNEMDELRDQVSTLETAQWDGARAQLTRGLGEMVAHSDMASASFESMQDLLEDALCGDASLERADRATSSAIDAYHASVQVSPLEVVAGFIDVASGIRNLVIEGRKAIDVLKSAAVRKSVRSATKAISPGIAAAAGGKTAAVGSATIDRANGRPANPTEIVMHALSGKVDVVNQRVVALQRHALKQSQLIVTNELRAAVRAADEALSALGHIEPGGLATSSNEVSVALVQLDATAADLKARMQLVEQLSTARAQGGGTALERGSGTRSVFESVVAARAKEPDAATLFIEDRLEVDATESVANDPTTRDRVVPHAYALQAKDPQRAKRWAAQLPPDPRNLLPSRVCASPNQVLLPTALGRAVASLGLPTVRVAPLDARVVGRDHETIVPIDRWLGERESILAGVNWHDTDNTP